jgi:hypothetical protein
MHHHYLVSIIGNQKPHEKGLPEEEGLSATNGAYQLACLLLGDDDLAVTIIATVAADVMRQLDSAALRADRASLDLEHTVGAPTGMSPHTSRLSLRYSHLLLLLEYGIWNTRYIGFRTNRYAIMPGPVCHLSDRFYINNTVSG